MKLRCRACTAVTVACTCAVVEPDDNVTCDGADCDGGLSGSVIAGIVVGCIAAVVVLIILIFLLIILVKKHQRKKQQAGSSYFIHFCLYSTCLVLGPRSRVNNFTAW